MNPELNEFLNAERKRVFEPDSYFAPRVVSQWTAQKRPAPRENGIWDFIPRATRPVFALALTLLLVFLTIETFVPVEPGIGMIEAYLAPEQSTADSVLYTESEVPSSRELLEQLIVLEEGEQ